MVVLLLQLNIASRRAVWLWLADPTQCGKSWFFAFRCLLEKLVQPHRLSTDHRWKKFIDRPLFYARCKHMAVGEMYLGLDECAMHLDGGGDDEDASDADFVGCHSLVAVEYWSSAHWQPVCCLAMQALHWDFVADALVKRHNKMIVAHDQDLRDRVLDTKNHWVLFGCL